MPRYFALSLTVLTASLLAGAVARAADPQPQRGYLYFPPVKSPASTYQARPVAQPQPQAQAVARIAHARLIATPAVPYGYAVPARPVSWGARYSVGTGYPASLFGQLTAPTYAQPTPTPAPLAQPMTPAYAQPNYGNGSMYMGTASTTPVTGYSSIYGYAGRFYGPYYGYGPSYYGYGGAGGWGTPYNSGYYGSGCYSANACCRASRRYCTPFGGMFRGCGSGCYLPTPAACPTACAYSNPCGQMTGSLTPVPQTYDSPTLTPSNTAPSNTGRANPAPTYNPAPPTPAPPDADAPTPVEKKVTPAPQAKNYPRFPNLPPDA